jgi:hypothetical protein
MAWGMKGRDLDILSDLKSFSMLRRPSHGGTVFASNDWQALELLELFGGELSVPSWASNKARLGD